MSQSVDEFKVSFDPSKKVDIKAKILEYGRTRASGGGQCSYSLPQSIVDDPLRLSNCPESQKPKLMYLDPNLLEIHENAQRLRPDVFDDKVIKGMNEKFDWDKFTPLEAVEFIDSEGASHYVCTEGYGRLIFCAMHPGITEVPVLVRKTNDYQDVVDSYYANHDKKLKTQITKGDDFSLAMRQGRPDALRIKEEIEKTGMTIDENKFQKNAVKDMIFTSADIGELAFQIHCNGKRVAQTQASVDKIIGVIDMYGALRNAFNKGEPIRDWNSVLMNVSNSIESWKASRAKWGESDPVIRRLTISNLIDRNKPRLRKDMRHIFDNDSYKNKQNKKVHKALAWLKALKSREYVSPEWLQTPPKNSEFTYFDLFLDEFEKKLQ